MFAKINVDLDTLNKRAANYLRVHIFAILLSFAKIAEISTVLKATLKNNYVLQK